MHNKQQQKRFYGRRIGRPLNDSRKAVIDDLLPVLEIDRDLLTENSDLDARSLFAPLSSRPNPAKPLGEDGDAEGSDQTADIQDPSTTPNSSARNDLKEIWFEIGFGTGEHLSALMRRHPDIGFIGAEPFINGMAAFLKDISQDYTLHLSSRPKARSAVVEGSYQTTDIQDPSTTPDGSARDDINVRILMDDAMMIANSLAAETLDGIYILNPDPWHKTRHHKRRIVRPETLDCFARILKPGGQLIMSTDVPYLAEWMVTHAAMHPAFSWTAKSAKDWQTPPPDWVHTAYETKRAKGADKMVYLFFKRV